MRHPHEPPFAPAKPLAVLPAPSAGQQSIPFPVIIQR